MVLIEEIKATRERGGSARVAARILEEGESSGKFRNVQDIDHTTVDATNPYEVK